LANLYACVPVRPTRGMTGSRPACRIDRGQRRRHIIYHRHYGDENGDPMHTRIFLVHSNELIFQIESSI
jgi:hypothetical protein